VVLNRSHLLAEAKAEVLRMVATGFAAPLPEKMYAVGRDGFAALQVGIHMYREGKYITEHEAVVANKLAKVIAGGDLSRPAWMDEQYFLDLEREAFLSCCGEEKTQQRMWHFLQHGKMLRN
jgi:3-hydroxyacyl-CoA dehydrogenase